MRSVGTPERPALIRIPKIKTMIPHEGLGSPKPDHYNHPMANLTLIYGLRLLPSDELAEVEDAKLKLKNGNDAHVAMHLLEGSKEEIEKQLRTSLEAFFDFYPEI